MGSFVSLIIAIALMCMTSLFFLFVFGFFAYLRYLKHKEMIAFAQKGLLPPQAIAPKNRESSGSLRQAIILIGVGAALTIGLYPIGWIAMPGQLPLNIGPWMVAGFIPLFFGLGLLLIHFLPVFQSFVDHRINAAADDRLSESEDAPVAEEQPGREQAGREQSLGEQVVPSRPTAPANQEERVARE